MSSAFNIYKKKEVYFKTILSKYTYFSQILYLQTYIILCTVHIFINAILSGRVKHVCTGYTVRVLV